MADAEPTLFERMLEEQQKWLQTMIGYADSLATDRQFLTNLSNAMQGSLMAGRAMPSALAGVAAAGQQDAVLHAMHTLEGKLADLALDVAELRTELRGLQANATTARRPAKPAAKTTARSAAKAAPKGSAKAGGKASGKGSKE